MNTPQVTDHGSKESHPEVVVQSNRAKRAVWLSRLGWGVVILIIILAFSQYLAAARYDALVQVIDENRYGINPRGENLDFGDLPRNKSATRQVSLENKGKYPIFISVWKRGEVSQLIRPNKNNFTLEPGKSAEIEFELNVPDSAENRYYKGKVVVFKLPKVWQHK